MIGRAILWGLRLVAAPWIRLGVEVVRRTDAYDDLARLIEELEP